MNHAAHPPIAAQHAPAIKSEVWRSRGMTHCWQVSVNGERIAGGTTRGLAPAERRAADAVYKAEREMGMTP